MDNYEGAFETRGPRAIEETPTKTVEPYTGSPPSSPYLGFAIAGMGLSLALLLGGREKWSHFIAHWVPALLALAVYDKLAAVQGEDPGVQRENRGYTS
jgi:hypothetical protein